MPERRADAVHVVSMPATSSRRSEPRMWFSLKGWPSGYLGVEHVADQVVARLLPARLQVAAEIFRQLHEAALQHVLVGGALLEDVVDPLAEAVAVAVGDARHVGDEAHGDMLGIVGQPRRTGPCR